MEMNPISRRDLFAKAVAECLDSHHLKYERVGDNNELFILPMTLSGKLNHCRLFISASDSGVSTHAICPINASPDSFEQVVEFITRANYGLKLGKFEMDYSDGEVRYSTCLYMTEGMPAADDLEHHILIPFMMMRRYGDGLVKSLMGLGHPEEDIAEIEG